MIRILEEPFTESCSKLHIILMGSIRCGHSRWPAVMLLSCVLVLSLMAHPDAFDDYWSLLSVKRTDTTQTEQRTMDVEGGKATEGKGQDNPVRLNVTDLVLSELRRGFFAAISENTGSGSPPDSVVCVSEPTVLECREAGFAALLLATLDHVSYCKMLGIHKVMIQWRNCQTSCTKDPQENSWPAYFEPLSAETELRANKVLCLGGSIVGRVLVRESTSSLLRLNAQQIKQFNIALRTSSLLDIGFRKRQNLLGYEEGAIITPELRKWAHALITEHLRPQKNIQSRVGKFYASHMRGFNVVGVHVRGTDHWSENEDKTLPTMAAWIHDTEVVFKTLREPKIIFLASDNDEIIDRFMEHFGKNKVIYTAAVRANNYYSKHPMNGEFTNDIDPIEIGSQVLIDILLLAKCGHFLHGESSVATLASFFNPEMKLFFIGNLGEDVHVDGDFKEKPLSGASVSEVEQDRELLEEQPQSLTWYFKANASYRTCPIIARGQLIGPKKKDGDVKEKPFYDSSEESEAEWEEDWDEQIQSLAWCFQANSPYSACPNMAKGLLVDSKEVWTFLAQ